MKAIQIFFVALVAFEHIYFMILEMFYLKLIYFFGIAPINSFK